MKTKLLHIALGTHNTGLWQSFNKHFDTTHYDWTQHKSDPAQINKEIVEIFNNIKPQVVFMQIQKSGIIQLDTAKLMTKSAFTINWTGDVRTPLPSWFVQLGKEIDMTLFSNVHDVRICRKMGVESDYLQVGFDPLVFKPFRKSQKNYGNIIFMGSNYTNKFPLSNYRENMVSNLHQKYGKDFQVYGMNWQNITERESTLLDQIQESIAYSNSHIAINLSHFDYERYSSDRLLRIMGSGAFCLSQNFKGIENDFELNEHLVVWDSINHLMEKIDRYWGDEYMRSKIALEGCKYVRSNCTWDCRMEEIKNIINVK